MVDCEKCKYYHDNCDSKFRCRIDVEKIRADAIDEIATELKSRLLDAITREHLESMTNLINDVAEMVKEKE